MKVQFCFVYLHQLCALEVERQSAYHRNYNLLERSSRSTTGGLFHFVKTYDMNNLKPLVWEDGESIVTSAPDPVLVSINELAEFAILIYNGDPDESDDVFKLEITFGGGHWDCFHYPTIEQCQERANAWWKEKIEDCFIFEVPAIKLEQCIACNGLGQIARLSKGDTAFKYNFETCKNCGGEGKVNCATSETLAQ